MAENNNKISNKNNKKLLSEENNNLKEKEIKTDIVERQFMSLMGSFNPTPKLSEDNINKLLENNDKHDKREFKEKRIFIITLSIFFGLIILSILSIFTDNTELLKGIIGGYGFGYKNGIDADN